jgi:hypothetical protein
MDASMSRRKLLMAGLIGIPFLPKLAAAQSAPQQPVAKPMRVPLSIEIVREFVGAGHGNLDKIKEMLGNEPGLLNATVDHNRGDFEAAIGGAGHVGHREIAQFLISQGARYDIFVAAMLGELELVKAFLKLHPSLVHSKGPHGISLLAHAKAGKGPAEPVVSFLQSLEA